MKQNKISEELRSDTINHIIRLRLIEKDSQVEDAIELLENGASYSLVYDVIRNSCRYSIGKCMGMYNLAVHLGIMSADDCEKCINTLGLMFDEDSIIESAINKMKGKRYNGD